MNRSIKPAAVNPVVVNSAAVNRVADPGLDHATTHGTEHALALQPLAASPTPAQPLLEPAVHVDCEGCSMRPLACGDCVVTFLLGSPPEGVDLAPDEQEALDVLAASGLVPVLRYAPIEADSPGPT